AEWSAWAGTRRIRARTPGAGWYRARDTPVRSSIPARGTTGRCPTSARRTRALPADRYGGAQCSSGRSSLPGFRRMSSPQSTSSEQYTRCRFPGRFTTSRPAGLGDDRVAEHAQVVDLDLDDVAGLEPDRGLAGHADARGRAGEDQVAGFQRED